MTLVELLTVMVIVAILASIAIPSYRRYLVRTNRSDAKTALMQLQAAQEKFYLQNNAYTDKVADKSPGRLSDSRRRRSTGYYDVSVEVGPEQPDLHGVRRAHYERRTIRGQGMQHLHDHRCRQARGHGARRRTAFSAGNDSAARCVIRHASLAAALLAAVASLDATAASDLKLATWNLEWLISPATFKTLEVGMQPAG